jgi:hypothetical protein
MRVFSVIGKLVRDCSVIYKVRDCSVIYKVRDCSVIYKECTTRIMRDCDVICEQEQS